MSHRFTGFVTRLALAATLFAPAAAMAQDAQPAAPAATPASAWIKECGEDPQSKKRVCIVVQELRAETGQFIASVQIRTVQDDPKISLITMVPVGMLIQPGVRVQVDQNQQQEVKYGICFPNACFGQAQIDANFVNSMKKGNQLIVTTLNQQGKAITFPLTLAGFTKTFDSEGLDAAAARAQREELNKALQQRAEQNRQRLIEQQNKEAGQ